MIQCRIFTIVLLLSGCLTSVAQTIDSTNTQQPNPSNDKRSFNLKERIFFGGNVGGGLGGGNLIVNAAPLVGLRITERYSAGVQGNYTYAQFNQAGFKQTEHIVGGSIFNRYFIWRDLFLHGEAELLNANWTGAERSNIYSLMAGGGYLFRFGSNGGMNIMALYNFLPNPYGVRRNPIINMGFIIGL